MQAPVHRHSRVRNPWMEGLSLEGVSGNFGKIAVIFLLLVGLVLAASRRSIRQSDLRAHTVHALNKPYQPGRDGRVRTMLILPIQEGRKMLLIENFALKAGGLQTLQEAIKPGDELVVLVQPKSDSMLLDRDGGMRVPITLLYKGQQALISEAAYNTQLARNSTIGWWVIALALSMVPYFFIANPRIHPAWVFTGVLAAMVLWLILS
ncbi:MAG: hypothetical protein MUF29_01925 [Chitinophagaceae bacterium]|nr:hypothetical protein [Chitinophagaceae bacterium]